MIHRWRARNVRQTIQVFDSDKLTTLKETYPLVSSSLLLHTGTNIENTHTRIHIPFFLLCMVCLLVINGQGLGRARVLAPAAHAPRVHPRRPALVCDRGFCTCACSYIYIYIYTLCLAHTSRSLCPLFSHALSRSISLSPGLTLSLSCAVLTQQLTQRSFYCQGISDESMSGWITALNAVTTATRRIRTNSRASMFFDSGSSGSIRVGSKASTRAASKAGSEASLSNA